MIRTRIIHRSPNSENSIVGICNQTKYVAMYKNLKCVLTGKYYEK